MCIKVGNLKNKEIEKLVAELKQRHEDAKLEYKKDVFCFNKQIMYEVLNTNSACHAICERNGYINWQELVNRFL